MPSAGGTSKEKEKKREKQKSAKTFLEQEKEQVSRKALFATGAREKLARTRGPRPGAD
jgi:hypothetical protein